MLQLAAICSFENGATIIDGGNHFNAYQVARLARFHTAEMRCLDSLQMARAFNCYQLVELLQRVPRNGAPCLVIDLLNTFEDDSTPAWERLRLLHKARESILQIADWQGLIVSLSPPQAALDEWQQMAAILRSTATTTLEEGFMGKTIPTINQIAQQAGVILARFSRVIQPEEREALDELFAASRAHIAAISEANHLLPFEVVQQAMILEQQKEIRRLKARLEELERRLG